MYVEILSFVGFRRGLIYLVPCELRVHIGSLVCINIRGKRALGIVKRFCERPLNYDVSEISHVIYDFPVLTEDLIRLAEWLTEYYGINFAQSFECILPAIIRKGKVARKKIILKAANALKDNDLHKLKKRAPKQYDAYQFVLSNGQIYYDEAVNIFSHAIIKALIDKEILTRYEGDEDLLGTLCNEKIDINLTDEQLDVVERLKKLLSANEYCTNLLFGVTGSGKTEIYHNLIRELCENTDKNVIYLLPEIALSEQAMSKIQSRLGLDGISSIIWHSKLSEQERLASWSRVIRGNVRVVIGTRSALFMPIKNIGMIIVDEEHEPSYKQSESPRYHGRDVAVYRAFLNNALCLLGTATPSLESWHNVKIGKYGIVSLTKRAYARKMPKISIVDMRYEKPNFEGSFILSALLREKIAQRLDNKEQTLLFLNRRGYATTIQCKNCGKTIQCKYCNVSLVYHKTSNSMQCHLCGHIYEFINKCPYCNKYSLTLLGLGTQRVESCITRLFPHAKVLRMDTDNLAKNKDIAKTWMNDVKNGNYDIIIGTQMIAKGLDFPNITLVGLLNADSHLNANDFRAEERTFQLLTQVSGRAGRANKPGEVIIQTFTPTADCIKMAVDNSVEPFLNKELLTRKKHNYPPFTHIIRHILRSRSEKVLEFFAKAWIDFANTELQKDFFELIGPTKPSQEKINGFYRMHALFFTKNVKTFLPNLLEIREKFKSHHSVIDIFDVDPLDFY